MIMLIPHGSSGHMTDWLHSCCNPQSTLFKSNRLHFLPGSKQEGGSQEKHHCMCVHLVRAGLMLVRKGCHRQRSLHQCKPCFRCTAAEDVTGDFSTGNGSSAACFVSVTWHKSCSSPRPSCAPRAFVRCAASAEDNCTTTVLRLCINKLSCGNDLAFFCNDLIAWLFLLVCHWAVVHTQVNGSLQAYISMEGICICVL